MEKCDPEIATWSESGDSFVVKSLDKFSKVRRNQTHWGFARTYQRPTLTDNPLYLRFRMIHNI